LDLETSKHLVQHKSSWKDTNNISTQISPSNCSNETTSHHKVSKHTPSTSTPKSPTKTSSTKCFKCLSFGHIAAKCPNKSTIMLQKVNQDHNQLKTKSANEREKEGQDTKGLILSPQRCFSSFSFSFPNNSKYLTSLIKKFRDDLQRPPKGSTLLRGFSQVHHLFPKHSLQTCPVSRIHPCELPKLHEHKFVSHPKLRNIFCVQTHYVICKRSKFELEFSPTWGA